MLTVHEVSRLTGVSVRALQYYDKIGLLPPAGYTDAGYRLYDDTALERLQQILFFKELEFPLKDIKKIMENPDYDRSKALKQQIEFLLLKKEHIENLIDLARKIKFTGGTRMNFTAFDTSKLEEYARQAKNFWGTTPEYREFEGKSGRRTPEEEKALSGQLMGIFTEFGTLKEKSADNPAVMEQVRKLQEYISEHYYKCSDSILSQLGAMYAAGGEFTTNIDAAGGPGTAAFVYEAIQAFCKE